MQLNKILVACFISAGLFAGVTNAASAASTFGGNGTIQFKGGVTDGACGIKAGSVNQVISLPTVKASKLTSNQEAGAVPFHISLEDCDNSVSSLVTTTFTGISGTNGAPAGTFSTNASSANAAKNVGLEIKDNDGNLVAPGVESLPSLITVAGGNMDLNYTAVYKAGAANATPGDFDTTVNFTMTYE